MRTILIIFFIILNGCGYQAINKSNNTNYVISNYKFIGDAQVNKILIRNFDKYKKRDDNLKEFNITIKSEQIKINNSKKRSGEATSLTLEVLIDVEITTSDNKLKKLSLRENTNYNNLDNKFELKQFEKIIINDLTNKLIDKIHFTLSAI
tara:strand:- start:1311 stop:1760 length:450 start_codon:yes stop_codon:yes gene_type:complete